MKRVRIGLVMMLVIIVLTVTPVLAETGGGVPGFSSGSECDMTCSGEFVNTMCLGLLSPTGDLEEDCTAWCFPIGWGFYCDCSGTACGWV